MISEIFSGFRTLGNCIRWLIGLGMFSIEYLYHLMMGYCFRWSWKGYPIFQQLSDPKSNPIMSFHESMGSGVHTSLDTPQQLRIGCLNLHYSDCQEELIQWCRDFDICCFQEVVGCFRKNISLLDKLSQHTEYNFHYFKDDYRFNHWMVGNGTLSRLPWLEFKIFQFESWLGRPNRNAIATKFQIENGCVWIVHTHFQHDWTGFQQECQFKELEMWLKELDGPCLVIGDFNYPLPIIKQFLSFQDVSTKNTYPSHCPVFHLDRVFVNSSCLEQFTIEVVVGKEHLSDHLPVSITLRKKR